MNREIKQIANETPKAEKPLKSEKPEFLDGFLEAEQYLRSNSIGMLNPGFAKIFSNDALLKDKIKITDVVGRQSEKKEKTRYGQDKEFDRKTEELAMAKIVEASVLFGLKEGKWFGKETQAKKTAEFDDRFNGVDVVAELPDQSDATEARHVALAVDATYSGDLKKKIANIAREIKGDYHHPDDETKRPPLANVKYYLDSQGEARQLESIPKVIACCNLETAKELEVKYWGKTDDGFGQEKDKEPLKNDQLKFQIMEEALVQLDFFANFAEKQHAPWAKEASAKYRQLYHELSMAYQESLCRRDEEGRPLKENKRQAVGKPYKNANGKLVRDSVEKTDYRWLDMGIRDSSYKTLRLELQALDEDIRVSEPYQEIKTAMMRELA